MENGKSSDSSFESEDVFDLENGDLLFRFPDHGGPNHMSSQEMAPHIVKALQHAVTLCAGTYQAPAQTNQPF